MLGAGDAAQEVARAPVLGQEPQDRDQREQADDELAGARVLPEQPQPVGAPEQPDLRAVERGQEADRERLPRVAVEVALDRDQDQRGHQALGVAERVVADEAAGEQQSDRGDETNARSAGSIGHQASRRGVAGRAAEELPIRRVRR